MHNFKKLGHWLGKFTTRAHVRLLEVGCGHGWFLEAVSSRFDVMGLEPDALVANRCQAQGLSVVQGFFPEALPINAKFDVLIFNDVLEHIPGVGAALQACDTALNAGGILVINIPSSRGVFYRAAKLAAKIGLPSVAMGVGGVLQGRLLGG
ncbi:class I SAM-dependent methyltransferase [Paucibacter sp. TC2R-5]|uniref:class I SAM-dependent methyltransferase n=1 Tax=Paucibacter sp. TC2R-5 TaxID=2893555 RepID=UPI0021E50BB4|nr:class I SAM-dependent methyltransferase [Paucibacter sp. TC2R-5]MCV2359833.1 class I SAM-dependent methyltransferase [Paucibacter sp. TC2R-5]